MRKLVFFKKQSWEKTPSYTYVEDDAALTDLKNQGIVIKEVDLKDDVVMGKEHAESVIKDLQAKGELWK